MDVNGNGLVQSADLAVTVTGATAGAASDIAIDFDTTGTGANTVTTGGGADTFTVANATDSITSGAGNDTATLAAVTTLGQWLWVPVLIPSLLAVPRCVVTLSGAEAVT